MAQNETLNNGLWLIWIVLTIGLISVGIITLFNIKYQLHLTVDFLFFIFILVIATILALIIVFFQLVVYYKKILPLLIRIKEKYSFLHRMHGTNNHHWHKCDHCKKWLKYFRGKAKKKNDLTIVQRTEFFFLTGF